MVMDIAAYITLITHDLPSFITNVDVYPTPLFTPYCGFCYFNEGHFWGFDSRKPYTYIYINCNLVLQGVCAVVVACVDVLIIWKIRKVRVRAISETRTKVFTVALSSQSTSVKQASTCREMQLAFNFIFLSACFLIMTTFYNINIDASIYGFITKLTYNLNLAKWSFYILGNKTIRMRFLSLLKCC
ncbi:hypothetical protein GCK32_002048 [Trichostrongylus colubriformis]|uniref:7TM GPCR serpentine receptor class x (Srx) domain-containing protein n=1 Tax=Trichostrongylus colubriformis TaxID=6319 RepID=A0AAN8F4S3_TRICO